MRYILELVLLVGFLLSFCYGCTDKDIALPSLVPEPISYEKLSDNLVDISRKGIDISIDMSMEAEAFQITILKKSISIVVADSMGIRYATQTLRQLKDYSNSGIVPELKIFDQPKFHYRGMHLDVARHIFDVADIKKYVDMLAYYKFNYFHWHLTEDQGWRIEIKKYPKLQSISAYRDSTLVGHYSDVPPQYDGKRYGGFYTQEEVKEIVDYAQSYGIVVIPEIEMPGHSLAALAAYPELGCVDTEYRTATKWGVFSDIYCPTEQTFSFLEDVIDEVVSLFPSKYIHIGGDEAPKDAWKKSRFCQDLISVKELKDEHGLQSYFISRMERYINGKGKQIIGWDEILEGGLAENATVMSWRGIKGGIKAAESGHNVIMTPTSHCYFDYYQSVNDTEPLAIGGYLPLQKVYEWDPIPDELDEAYHKYILGGQGNVWTEYMPTFDQVEYMAYSRMIALSETLWRGNDNKLEYSDFLKRYTDHVNHWEKSGVNIANHTLDLNYIIAKSDNGKLFIKLKDRIANATIKVTSPRETRLLGVEETKYQIDGSGKYTFTASNGGREGRPSIVDVKWHKAMGCEIALKNEPNQAYPGYGALSLINGIRGSQEKYSGNEWLGFSGESMDATLNFDSTIDIESIQVSTFNSPGQWIYPPKSIDVWVKTITKDEFEKVDIQEKLDNVKHKIHSQELMLNKKDVVAIRVLAMDHGVIAEGNQGAGNRAWLFIDEIVVR